MFSALSMGLCTETVAAPPCCGAGPLNARFWLRWKLSKKDQPDRHSPGKFFYQIIEALAWESDSYFFAFLKHVQVV